MSSRRSTVIIHPLRLGLRAILAADGALRGSMNLPTSIDTTTVIAWAVLAVLIVALALWTWSVQRRAARLQRRLEAIVGDVENPNTAQLLAEYLSTVRSTAASVQRMRIEHDELVQLMPSAIRHVGLVRFSPFHDTGGDQSFALALLDGRGDGVVVTGLHSRHDSRLYAKPIARNNSSYSLTPEEREAMERALSGNAARVS